MKSNVISAAVFLVLIGLFALSSNDWKVPWAGTAARPEGVAWCEAHNVAMDACESCNIKLARGGTFSVMRRDPQTGECKNTLVQIEVGQDTAKKINLQTHVIEAKPLEEYLDANADADYVPSKYSKVAPRIPGLIREVKAILGQEVDAGTVLAVLESPDFGSAQSDYLQAKTVLELRRKTYEQKKAIAGQLAAKEILEAETEFREAELALLKARQRLSALGLNKDQIDGLQEASPVMHVVAPFRGVVVDASAVPGELAAPERPIFSVADMSRLWVCIDLPESELPKMAKDQRVFFTVKGLDGEYRGKVVAISSEVNERTRTGRLFAEIKNKDGLLRAKMFGRARIITKETEDKVVVPRDAVHDDNDGCKVVFVNTSGNKYQVKPVTLGVSYGQEIEIKEGLTPGDTVVTLGSFHLKGEMLRGEMGAG